MSKRAGVITIDVVAGTGKATVDVENLTNKLRQLGTHGVSNVQATSAALRVMEGSMTNNLRAAERFLANTLGVGSALRAAFPVVGAIAFLGVLGELVKKVYEFHKGLQEAGLKAQIAFRELSSSLRITNDGLDVSNARLENEIAKLEGKPGNGLQLALLEAKEAADKLAQSLDTDLDKLEKIDKESYGGFWNGVGNFLRSKAGAGDIQDEIKRFREKLAGVGADAGSQLTALQQEVNRFESQINQSQYLKEHPRKAGGLSESIPTTGVDFNGSTITSGGSDERIQALQRNLADLRLMAGKIGGTLLQAPLQAQVDKLKAVETLVEKQQEILKEVNRAHEEMQKRIAGEQGWLNKETEDYRQHVGLINELTNKEEKRNQLLIAHKDLVDAVYFSWRKQLDELTDELPRLTSEIDSVIQRARRENSESSIFPSSERQWFGIGPGNRPPIGDMGSRPAWESNKSDFESRARLQLAIQEQRIRLMASAGSEVDTAKKVYGVKLQEIELDRQKELELAKQLQGEKALDAEKEANYRAETARIKAQADLDDAVYAKRKQLIDSIISPTSNNLATMLTSKKPKGGWGQMWGQEFQGIGHQLIQTQIHSALEKGLAAIGINAKADGSQRNPFYVRNADGTLSPTSTGNHPWSEKAPGNIGGWFQTLGSIFGAAKGAGGQSIGTIDGQIATAPDFGGFRAGGGDMYPGNVYGVAEAGEAELVMPKQSSRIVPLSKMGGSITVINHVDARGSELGVENRINAGLEAVHNAAVTHATRVQAEHQKRTPQKSR